MKEGLVITIYLKHMRDTPELSIPPILPRAILTIPEKVLSDRLTYLSHLSMRRTKEERKGAKLRLHVGVSQGKKKRKLSSDPKEDDLATSAAKKPKVFTHSAQKW